MDDKLEGTDYDEAVCVCVCDQQLADRWQIAFTQAGESWNDHAMAEHLRLIVG